MVRIEEDKIYGWEGYRLTSGDVSIGVIPQVGGRIISMRHRGEELFFVQDEFKGQVMDLYNIPDLRTAKKDIGFRLWGGDKTWVAPQWDWWEDIPPLDLDAGSYKVKTDDTGIQMTSPLCRETGLRIIRRVEFRSDGSVALHQTFRNETDQPVRRGIWDVTQCLRPFEIYIASRREAVRPSWESIDTKKVNGYATSVDGGVQIACRDNTLFKFGGMVDRGLICAVRQNGSHTLSLARLFEFEPAAEYAHNAVVEIYNSPDHEYFEIEVHAPLSSIPPGSEVSHRQIWKTDRFEGRLSASEAARRYLGSD